MYYGDRAHMERDGRRNTLVREIYIVDYYIINEEHKKNYVKIVTYLCDI